MNTVRSVVTDCLNRVWRFSARWRRASSKPTRIVFWSLTVFSALFVTYLFVLYARMSLRMDRYVWDVPSRIYAEPLALYPGASVTLREADDALSALGYWSVSTLPNRPGEYRVQGNTLDVYLRSREFADGKEDARRVQMRFSGGVREARELNEDGVGEPLALVRFDPAVASRIYDDVLEEREIVPIKQLPPHLIDAIIAIEDKRYFGHIGLSPRGIARAAAANFKAQWIEQGGSTITQQLVKNLYLTHKRTLPRKVNEMFMAIMMELRYSKKTILNAYVNEIYLGQSGSVSICGVGSAARFYFGKDARGLTVEEAALLAGMIRSPYRYSFLTDTGRASERRELVLRRMLEEKKIDAATFERARKATLPKRVHPVAARSMPYLIDAIVEEVPISKKALATRGYRIYTSVDPKMQRAAEEAARAQAKRLTRNGSSPQIAFVAANPHTGRIVALVGGVDYGVSQFNRATHAARQTGSVFKPIVYATAFEDAVLNAPGEFTPTTRLNDAPMVWEVDGVAWKPRNSQGSHFGSVTVRVALEESLNVPAVRVGQRVGIDHALDTAKALGVERKMPNVPAVVLGAGEMTPVDVLTVYSAFAGSGVRVEPHIVARVVDSKGREVYRRR
ncbi:MAG: transglycosylase domain-containing protein, partial [Candidatus Poribacteria bacterium]|nr:transglycosylase domain-containing protein [Candidatus Poribacteria bacterium]